MCIYRVKLYGAHHFIGVFGVYLCSTTKISCKTYYFANHISQISLLQ